MKAILGWIWVLSSVIAAPGPATAQSRPAGRTVELIPMKAPVFQPASAAPSPRDGGEEERATQVQIIDAAAFAVHDLQRRWVAFQMSNSFAAAGIPRPVATNRYAAPGLEGPRDPLADLNIPAWMRDDSYIAAPASTGRDCYRAQYQPTGFLSLAAEGRRAAYYALMSDAACAHGIPVGLFDAMIIQESRYNAAAVSRKSAFGLTQLMPDTAAGLGVDRFDPAQNLMGGARYLRRQIDRFGQFHLALAAYNAGPGNVKNGRVPPFAETRAYVGRVLAYWSKLAFASRAPTAPSALTPRYRGNPGGRASPRPRAVSVLVF